MFKYTKSSEVNPPEKQTNENGANFFSPLGQYSKKSQKRKAPASVESRMGPFRCWNQMLCPYIIPTASNYVALKATGVHTNPQKDAATNSKKKKHCHLCPGIADAKWTQQ